ncbi:HI1506-related protein, partial [Lactococcus petauri]|uniref:HI1506-related protein n=1 Tax=Lactococcus petauri TaxID=1940789 RepID=UPI0021F1B3F3
MDTPAESTFHVWVKALPENGFHRAGRFWPSEWSEADVTAMQLATLEGEKHLAVRRINPEEISAVQAIQME